MNEASSIDDPRKLMKAMDIYDQLLSSALDRVRDHPDYLSVQELMVSESSRPCRETDDPDPGQSTNPPVEEDL